MIERIPNADHIDLQPGEVLEVYRSINQNLMSAESYPSQPSEATVIGAKRDSRIGVFVHYFLYDDGVGLLYREPAAADPGNYADLRNQTLEAVEAMGFLMENMEFRQLDAGEQATLMGRLPAFGGQGRHVGEAPTTGSAAPPDDESVVLLDETVTQAVASGDADGEFSRVDLRTDDWKVFFRMIASL